MTRQRRRIATATIPTVTVPRHGARPYDPDTQRIFFIVGAGKSGSTTLFDHLARHPDVATAHVKEPEYYSDPDVFAQGIDWYVGSFGSDAISSGKCLLDASSHYSQYPCAMDAAALIRQDFPLARFAYIVRDPADRWYSNYKHIMRNGIDRTPEQVFDQEPRPAHGEFIRLSVPTLPRHFPENSIMTLTLSQLGQETDRTVAAVLEHAGLPAEDLSATSSLHSNEGGPDHYLRAKTTSRLFAFPGGDRVRGLIPDRVKSKAFEVLRRSPLGDHHLRDWNPPPFSDELRNRVYDTLADDMDLFESLTGIAVRDSVDVG